MENLNLNLLNDKGEYCDLILFRDVLGTPLGIAKVDSMNFILPEGTMYFDYYHQSLDIPKLTRCICGEKAKEDNHNYVICKDGSITNKISIDTKEDEFIETKVVSTKEELGNILINELLATKNISKEDNKDQLKRAV